MKEEKKVVCKEITKIVRPALTLATGAALLYAGYKYGLDQGAGLALGLMSRWNLDEANKFWEYVLKQNSKLVK